MADQVLAVWRDHYPPVRCRRRPEAFGGVVELADEATEPVHLARRERREGVGHLPGDVLQDVAPLLVASKRARRPGEADVGEVIQQRLDSRCRNRHRLAHGGTDPDHGLRDIPALKDVFGR